MFEFKHKQNMAEFPYSMSIGRMQEFLRERLPSMGRPEKVTLKTIEALGFKSTNDRTIIPTLRFLGIIDASGTPTEAWQALRDRENSRKVMAALITHAYGDLFISFPDAPTRSERDLRNYISTHTKTNERTVGAMVGVFKMLCALSDFEGEPVSPEEIAANRPGTNNLERGTQRLSGKAVAVEAGTPSIQLHLTISENASIDQIEATLRYAAKYILGREV